jgi:Zn-finger protein
MMNLKSMAEVLPYSAVVEDNGKVAVVIVPAHARGGPRYARVSLERGPVVRAVCETAVYPSVDPEYVPCESHGQVCYHCLAALTLVCKQRVLFFPDRGKADEYAGRKGCKCFDVQAGAGRVTVVFRAMVKECTPVVDRGMMADGTMVY